jgi:hypothetical protein
MVSISLNELAKNACYGLAGAFYLVGSSVFQCMEFY